MSIRPFQLPQDIDLMNCLVREGFQYPENPDWSVQEDEVQDMVDRMNGAKRLWPILSLIRTFMPLFRDILCGFIYEEDHKPVGLINYTRQRNAPEWYIANVTVLPAYRRRGIARRLVEATIRELRNRKAEIAFLDVVVGNDPAFNLYKELGFDPFTQSAEYHFQNDTSIASTSLPEGYTLKPLSRFDWKTRFELAKRITPEHITHYEAVTEARFRTPLIMPLFGMLFETAGGSRGARFAIYTSSNEVIGVGQYTYRTRPGGTNFAQVRIDPQHPELSEFILRYVFSAMRKVSAGRRIELNFDDWETPLIECAEELGCEKRFGLHRMGLRF
jgi:ribosomal protein S18 acetylase RimI-like enzyme